MNTFFTWFDDKLVDHILGRERIVMEAQVLRASSVLGSSRGTVRAALTGQLWDTTADAAVAGNLLFTIFLSS